MCSFFLLGLGIVDASSWVCLGFLIDLTSFEMSLEACVFFGPFFNLLFLKLHVVQ
jgi:hypothetical protein